MAEFHGWVNPTNIADIDLNARDGRRLQEGMARFEVRFGTPLDWNWVEGLGAAPAPDRNLYLWQQVDVPPAEVTYYDRTTSLAFRNAANTGPGTVGDPNSVVVETANYAQKPIDELYDLKRKEIGSQDSTVRFNALDTSLNANWWLILTETARFSLTSLGMAANRREIKGQPWPGGANQPFVAIYNANTTDARRFQIDEPTWETLLTEWAQRDQATDAATDASRSALDVAYNDGLGDWQAVADHDPASPAWNYPATVNPVELRAVT